MAQTLQALKATRTIHTNDGEKYTLQPLVLEDLEEYYKLHADARTWQHYPSARHQNIAQSRKNLEARSSEWKDGVSYWSIRTADGTFAGVGGLRSYLDGKCWNIYYRISPELQGRGLATKIALEAVDLARIAAPDLPVVSYMLANNPASRKVAEKIGFTLRWKGADAGNPDKEAIRLIYSDRPLDENVLNALTLYG